MEKYQKSIKKYYRHQKTRTGLFKKKTKNYADSLFIRIFLSSLILLLLVIGKEYYNFNANFLTRNINFTNVASKLLGNSETIVNNDYWYDTYYYQNTTNYFTSDSQNGTYLLAPGTVVKINKNDDRYNLTIQGLDNKLYEYLDLIEVNCYLYEYLDGNKFIGTNPFINEKYQQKVKITQDELPLSYH